MDKAVVIAKQVLRMQDRIEELQAEVERLKFYEQEFNRLIDGYTSNYNDAAIAALAGLIGTPVVDTSRIASCTEGL